MRCVLLSLVIVCQEQIYNYNTITVVLKVALDHAQMLVIQSILRVLHENVSGYRGDVCDLNTAH